MVLLAIFVASIPFSLSSDQALRPVAAEGTTTVEAAGSHVWPLWLAATMLFAYVAFFSFAYLTLSAGTGALLRRAHRFPS